MLNEVMKIKVCVITDDIAKSARGKARKARGVRRTFGVRRNNEGRSATQHMDFLRGRHA
jgi:hypothetical protein